MLNMIVSWLIAIPLIWGLLQINHVITTLYATPFGRMAVQVVSTGLLVVAFVLLISNAGRFIYRDK
jgi:hypothetical protein